MKLLLAGAIVVLAAFANGAFAAEPTSAGERLGEFRAAAREARTRGDWAAYRVAAGRIKELLNESPQSRLELARALIHVDNETAALDEIAAYARMGQAADVVEELPDFEPLRERKAFEAIRTSMATNRRPVARSTMAFQLPDAELLPEDIDFDAQAKRFFLTSVLQRRIVSTAGDGPLAEFAKSPSGWPMFALKIDARRQLLWATEVAVSGFTSLAESDRGRSAVLCYDLKSGKLLRRIEGPRPSALGDMVLTADGSVIVSDGEHGGVYRLAPGKDELERLDAGDFISPQTPAMSRDAARVYVPDYVRGLGVLDLRTRQVRWLPTAGRFALDGIDGLYRVGAQLIAVQNGTSPERVVQFSTDAAATTIAGEQVIERATATLGDPTHGVMVGDTFYYIANSGWDALNADGSRIEQVTMSGARIMKWKPAPTR